MPIRLCVEKTKNLDPIQPPPIRLCVEKTKNLDQIQPKRTWRQKWTKILTGLFSPNLKPLE